MSANDRFMTLHSGQAIPLAEVPQLALDDFCQTLLDVPARGQRVAALFGDAPGSVRSTGTVAQEIGGSALRSTTPYGFS